MSDGNNPYPFGRPWVDESLLDDCSAMIVGKKASATGGFSSATTRMTAAMRHDQYGQALIGQVNTHFRASVREDPAGPRTWAYYGLKREQTGRHPSAIPLSMSGAWP